MITQQPSVGRVVHYVSHGTPVRPDGSQAYTKECRAAIITAVEPGQPFVKWAGTEPQDAGPEHDAQVSLCVLNPAGMFFREGPVPYDEDGRAGGSWHWPERV
ncbi:MAG TPA: hypothetical protein VFQ42_04130 [Mycobacterium sp.]|nr:hypothetical protein [Mycobacterium sp.]